MQLHSMEDSNDESVYTAMEMLGIAIYVGNGSFSESASL